MRNILIRCDGSESVGLGHVVRCLAFAEELENNHNCNVHFAMRTSQLGIDVVKKSYPVFQSIEFNFDYARWLIHCITSIEAQILILDSRDNLGRNALRKVTKHSRVKVVTIDDPEDKRIECDIAFYPPVPQLDLISWVGFKGKLFVGWEYIILRKEFQDKHKVFQDNKVNILVSMGGTDPENLTLSVIETLQMVSHEFYAIIIVGSGYSYCENLVNALTTVNYKYELHENPRNIAKVMEKADLGVISFGMTAYELAALGIPALYFCSTKDHEESARLFVKEGIGILSKSCYTVNPLMLREQISLLIENTTERKLMSERADKLHMSNINSMASLVIKGIENV